jgi:hypothetical protein
VYGVFSTLTFLWGDFPEQQQMEMSQKKPEAVENATASQTTLSICLPRVAWMLKGLSAVSKTAAREP